ncbi:hypothetical protein [Pseudomonas syringae]|uniref:hypothetical protein n=1 Tax=Pseudomonas syringae TaxID=317 RepID=UPI0012AF59EB|nr:hypothetical protein [Pseudomonas syringae]MBS7418653.1 hypothetical protein [Pseudomonas syringae]
MKKILITACLLKDIKVLKSPQNFNLADTFFRYERSRDLFITNYLKSLYLKHEGSQPDYHIVKNFKEILRFQEFGEGLVGHVRYAADEYLGVKPQEII